MAFIRILILKAHEGDKAPDSETACANEEFRQVTVPCSAAVGGRMVAVQVFACEYSSAAKDLTSAFQ